MANSFAADKKPEILTLKKSTARRIKQTEGQDPVGQSTADSSVQLDESPLTPDIREGEVSESPLTPDIREGEVSKSPLTPDIREGEVSKSPLTSEFEEQEVSELSAFVEWLVKIDPTDDNESKAQKRRYYTLGYAISSSIFLLSILSGPLAVVLCLFPSITFLLSKIARLSRAIKSTQDNQDYEIQVASLLSEKFIQPGTKMYSLLDETKIVVPEDGNVDILLFLPSGRIFAINVVNIINLEGKLVKVFLNTEKGMLMYRKSRESNSKFKKNPTEFINRGVLWLKRNEPAILPKEPIKIVVCAAPIDLYLHENTPKVKVEGKNYLYVDGVYVVKQNNLVKLIKTLNPLNPKKKSPKVAQKPKQVL